MPSTFGLFQKMVQLGTSVMCARVDVHEPSQYELFTLENVHMSLTGLVDLFCNNE